MLKTVCLDTKKKEFDWDVPAEKLDEICKLKDKIIWVDISDPHGDDFQQLAEEFNFHPLAIEDCKHTHQRPKIETHEGYYYMVLYEAELVGDDDDLELRELNIFLGQNYLVTVHSRPIRTIETTKQLWKSWTEYAEQGVGVLVYLLVDAIVDDYMTLLDVMSDQIDDLEDKVFEEFSTDAIEDIFRIKKQLLYLRRSVTPLRDVFNSLLRREQPIFSRETHIYFQDVFDHLIRVADTIDTLRDMVGSAMDAYLSVTSNRMNVVMKRLTSISTILMSVTLIAGVYGMNFLYMPELKWRYGYVFALLSMVFVAFALIIYLKRIKWL